MTVKMITMGYSARINMENFEGVEPRIEITAEVDEGEDPDAVKAALCSQVKRDWNYLAQVIVGHVLERRKNTPHKNQRENVNFAIDVLNSLTQQS